MVRIIIKGGVWRNTEDEILKAAISKYGKNQWARISSLLSRKTPKQCKARWYEWLDPSIKKIEWSKTEDEKLLHLAKLMPTQWRTIAPIVGRTATQCLERYQKLLDEAEARDSELGLGGPEGGENAPAEGGAGGSGDARRLRAGEVDVDQETKPARPDPVDMDEDEKEMLSEARARLANTQGKKAKRKARERQLEEARRLAALQKKRELKAAGIILRHKNKKGGMDYNADIPFNKQPVPGFYDVSEENAKRLEAPVGQTLKQLDGKRRRELEESEEKRKKQKKDKGGAGAGGGQNAQFIAAREAQIAKMKETEQIIKRRKLNLPQPQVGEAELEDIVKIGRGSRAARDLVVGEGEAGEASEKLIGDYDSLSRARTAKTPRTAPQEDNIMAEARNLRNMSMAQTPLLGDENTPLHRPEFGGTGFEGATPRHQVTATPNPLATPLHGAGRDFGATPRTGPESSYGETPMRTPMRDNLSINAEGYSQFGETPRDVRLREQQMRRSLKAGFASLPKPEDNYEFDEPEVEDEADEEVMLSEEDAAERDARLLRLQQEEEAKALARRSTVVKKDLPRPINVDLQRLVDQLAEVAQSRGAGQENFEIDQMVDYELVQMMLHDAIVHPLPGSNVPAGVTSQYEMPSDEDLERAREEVDREVAEGMGLPGGSESQIRAAIDALVLEDEGFMRGGWAAEREKLVFDTTSNQWKEKSELSPETTRTNYANTINTIMTDLISSSAQATKAEKKLSKQLGGYQAIQGKLMERIVKASEGLKDQQRDLESFGMLRVLEEVGGPRRVREKREEVELLEGRERGLQGRYADLADERKELMAKIEKLEEDKLVADAQDALDAQEEAIEAGMDEMAENDASVADI